jgi:hypothetical protein
MKLLVIKGLHNFKKEILLCGESNMVGEFANIQGERSSVCFMGVSSPRKSSLCFVIAQEICLEACGWQPYNAVQLSSKLEFRRLKKNKIKPISF